MSIAISGDGSGASGPERPPKRLQVPENRQLVTSTVANDEAIDAVLGKRPRRSSPQVVHVMGVDV